MEVIVPYMIYFVPVISLQTSLLYPGYYINRFLSKHILYPMIIN